MQQQLNPVFESFFFRHAAAVPSTEFTAIIAVTPITIIPIICCCHQPDDDDAACFCDVNSIDDDGIGGEGLGAEEEERQAGDASADRAGKTHGIFLDEKGEEDSSAHVRKYSKKFNLRSQQEALVGDVVPARSSNFQSFSPPRPV